MVTTRIVSDHLQSPNFCFWSMKASKIVRNRHLYTYAFLPLHICTKSVEVRDFKNKNSDSNGILDDDHLIMMRMIMMMIMTTIKMMMKMMV